jgi:hypothetical protein
MSHARAAVAGMLAAVILVIALRADVTEPAPQHVLVAFLILVGVIALLVGVDVVAELRHRRSREDDE